MLLMLLQEFTHTSPVLAFTSRDFDHDSQSFLETIHIKPKPNSNQVIILVPIYVPAARRTVPAIDTRFERSLGHDQRVPTFAEQLFLTLMAQHDVPGSRDNKKRRGTATYLHTSLKQRSFLYKVLKNEMSWALHFVIKLNSQQ